MLNMKRRLSEYDFQETEVNMLYPMRRMNQSSRKEFINNLGFDICSEFMAEPLIYTQKCQLFNYDFKGNLIYTLEELEDLELRIDEVFIDMGNSRYIQNTSVIMSVFYIDRSDISNPRICFELQENLMLILGGYITVPKGALITIEDNYQGLNTIKVLNETADGYPIEEILDIELDLINAGFYNSDISYNILDRDGSVIKDDLEMKSVSTITINTEWEFDRSLVVFTNSPELAQKYGMSQYDYGLYVVTSEQWEFSPKTDILATSEGFTIDINDTTNGREQQLFILQYEG